MPGQILGTKIFSRSPDRDEESRAERLRVSFQELISEICTDESKQAFLCLFTVGSRLHGDCSENHSLPTAMHPVKAAL